MTEKKYLYFLKIGIFLSLISLFLVFSGLIFPFVTSKQLVFNILIEVLFVFYLVFISKYPAYRPKKSYLGFAFLTYFIAIFLSLFVSVDFNLSFWGDFERMQGFFHLLHFLALYLMTVSVFRTKEDYYWLFNAMILTCLTISIFMISNSDAKYSQSLLGNRAYLAALILFSIFLSLLMIIRSKNWWLKSAYIVSILIFIFTLTKADISGAYAGLLAGIFAFLFLVSILNKNKKKKTIGLSLLLFFIILVSVLFYFRSHSVFDNTYLGRALRDFSSENITLNTRIISWKAAAKYLINHPLNMVFGVGLGNYALVFDKYFDADFYNYDRHATYFDRAHNNLIDITTTTGILGLLTYSLFIIFLFYFLFKSYSRHCKNQDDPNALNLLELSALCALLVAYFVQNLAVFDSFSTYIYLSFFTAYVSFLELSSRASTEKLKKNALKIKESVLFLSLALIFTIIIFNINVRAIKTAKTTIDAHISLAKGDIIETYEKFKEAFAYQSVLVRDSRDSYITLLTSNFDTILKNNSLDDLEDVVSLGIEVANFNLDYNTNDSLTLYRTATMYELAGRFYAKKGDKQLAIENSSLALKMIDLSIEASPERVPLYSFKSVILINFDKNQEAIETLNYAKVLNPKMPDAFCQVANIYFWEDDFDNFISNLQTCINNQGFELMNFGNFIYQYESKLVSEEQFKKLIKIYDLVLDKYSDDLNWLSHGAEAYYAAGDFSKARFYAEKILELDQSYQEEVETFLELCDAQEN